MKTWLVIDDIKYNLHDTNFAADLPPVQIPMNIKAYLKTTRTCIIYYVICL